MAKPQSSNIEEAPPKEDDEHSSPSDEEEGGGGIEFILDPQTGRVPLLEGGTEMNYNFRSFTNTVTVDTTTTTSNESTGSSAGVDITLLTKDMKTATSARSTTSTGVTSQYSSGSTFFCPSQMKPRCGLEKMALEVFNFHTEGVRFVPGRSGAEWWTQVIDVRDDIGVHWDRDYGMESYGKNVHPHIATVTYLTSIGGPTLVIPHVSGAEVASDFTGSADKLYLSYPAVGKHMSFDGRYLHAAPADLIPVEAKGKRLTFLVNIWLNHCPLESEPLEDKHLMKMSVGVDMVSDLKFCNEVETVDIKCDSDDKIQNESNTLDLNFLHDSRPSMLVIPKAADGIKKVVAEKGGGKGAVCLLFSGEAGDSVSVVAGEEEEVGGSEEEGSESESESEDEYEDEEDEDDSSDEEDEEEEVKPRKKRKT